MPKDDHYNRFLDDPDEIQSEEQEDEDDFTEQELEDYYDMMGDFPELDGMDDILDYDDSDFYGAGEH